MMMLVGSRYSTIFSFTFFYFIFLYFPLFYFVGFVGVKTHICRELCSTNSGFTEVNPHLSGRNNEFFFNVGNYVRQTKIFCFMENCRFSCLLLRHTAVASYLQLLNQC